MEWQEYGGLVECHEARIDTRWPEYIRGVVIAEEGRRPEGGYTAYVEYFKHGIPRQTWGQQVFADSEQARLWCEEEMARLAHP